MGERLSGGAQNQQVRLSRAGLLICVVPFLVIGLVFVGIGVVNGEGRLRVKDADSITIQIRETGQTILLSDEETEAFKDVFDGKATYRMGEGEEPVFEGYVITVSAGEKTFYVSKDTVTVEEAGQGYSLRMLSTEWTDFKALLQSRNIAL